MTKRGAKKLTFLNTRNLVRVLDAAAEFGNWEIVMGQIGASERLAFEWRARCNRAKSENDRSSIFWLEYRDEWGWWTDFAGRCRSEHLMAAEAVMRGQAKSGYDEPVFGPDQKPIWRERPETIGRSDDYIRQMDGLGDWEDVDRLLRDERGHPQQLTKRVQVAVPIRKAVLAASHPDYREQVNVSVEHSGVVQISKPLERLASEPRADVSELRRLAAMTPEQRREALGASRFPKNPQTGLIARANTGAGPSTDNRSDHVKEQQPVEPPVNPRAYEQPALNPPNAPRPSYAKPTRALDTGERTGRGVPPEGGFRVR